MSEMIEADVVGHFGEVRSVYRDASLERMVDGRIADELPRCVSYEVPVERILAKCSELASPRELGAVDVGPSALLDDDLRPPLRRVDRANVASGSDDDVPRDVRDLRALVEAHLSRAPGVGLGEHAMVERERRRDRDGAPVRADRADLALLGLGEVETARSKDDVVSWPPRYGRLEAHFSRGREDVGREPLPAKVLGSVAEQSKGTTVRHGECRRRRGVRVAGRGGGVADVT